MDSPASAVSPPTSNRAPASPAERASEGRSRLSVRTRPMAVASSGNRGAGTVSVLDARSGAESHRIVVGNGPGDCAVDPVTGRLLVTNAGSGTLTVVERPWLPPQQERERRHPAVGRPLPGFALPDLRAGRLRRSVEWAEKRYIICFFASW
jgi:hypothetical protein